MEIIISLPNTSHLTFQLYVVQKHIPLVICIESIHHQLLMIYFGERTFIGMDTKCRLPMTHNHGHVFWTWKNQNVCFTHAELKRLHFYIFHPVADLLFAIVKKIRRRESGGELWKTIKDKSVDRESCAKFSKRPFTFRASLPPDKIVFNY